MRTKKEFDLTLIETIDDKGNPSFSVKWKDVAGDDYEIKDLAPTEFVFDYYKVLLTIEEKDG